MTVTQLRASAESMNIRPRFMVAAHELRQHCHHLIILPLILVSERLYSPELLVCLCPEDDKRRDLMTSPWHVCHHDTILHFC